ncbi:hypothetical protein ACM55F_10015 [Flavobacterium sp. XS2P12]|uniref:hypothetical protein n=1 Tax=Flavobacterium melibiosi TaxID=3398734 RepID=UPI003A84E367
MYEEKTYEYVTANVTLTNGTVLANEPIVIPDGKVVAISAIVAGDTENRIINLSVLSNGNEVVRPADVRFSQKTNGGTFRDSMRPVNFLGGRSFEARLVALSLSATQTVTVQVLFMIEKLDTN